VTSDFLYTSRYSVHLRMQDEKEAYLLLILSDANLPTGSFVASAGLESTAAHALFHLPTSNPAGSDIFAFLGNSVDTYARSALPFARDAHRVTAAYASKQIVELDQALAVLARLDALYDASTLNHVTRRASCAQGAALLTLYTKGFTRPPLMMSDLVVRVATTTVPNAQAPIIGDDDDDDDDLEHESRAGVLVATLKLCVRRGDADFLGHLPVCWGVLAGALGLTIGKLAAFVSIPPPRHAPHYTALVSRPRCLPAPLPPCARRVVRGGTHECFGPVRRAAAPAARGETHAF
jgi:urease accessory protein